MSQSELIPDAALRIVADGEHSEDGVHYADGAYVRTSEIAKELIALREAAKALSHALNENHSETYASLDALEGLLPGFRQ